MGFLIIAILVFLVDWSFVTHKQVIYPVDCVDGFYFKDDGKCSTKKEAVFSTFTVETTSKSRQVVRRNYSGRTYLNSLSYDGCTIKDIKNWECVADGFNFGSKNGQYFQPNNVNTKYVDKFSYYRYLIQK